MNDYQHLVSPKLGAPPTVEFAMNLRKSSASPSLGTQERRSELFSFYEKDTQNWKARVDASKKREKRKLQVLGKDTQSPRNNAVYDIFDADAKGNTGLVRPASRGLLDRAPDQANRR
jgi:hypothetical protein